MYVNLDKYFNSHSGCGCTCGNCECNCQRENCHICRQMYMMNITDGSNHVITRCRIQCMYTLKYSINLSDHYLRHYLCFNCKIGRKDRSECYLCKKPVLQVSSNIRVPKKNDKHGWKLLELLLTKDVFSKSKKDTLASYWYNNGGLNCTEHMSRTTSKLFMIPTKMNQYDDWCIYMNNTMFPK